MEALPELVGTVHIILGPYRGNPIALYMRQEGSVCQISPRVYPWNRTIGVGETPNKAAADFEAKWRQTGLTEEMYHGPNWEGGIKPEKPKPAPPPKPAVSPGAKVDAAPKTNASSPSVSTSAPQPSESTETKEPLPPDPSLS